MNEQRYVPAPTKLFKKGIPFEKISTEQLKEKATCYKECFCDGVYGYYAQDGFIGKVLLRLKELPLILDI